MAGRDQAGPAALGPGPGGEAGAAGCVVRGQQVGGGLPEDGPGVVAEQPFGGGGQRSTRPWASSGSVTAPVSSPLQPLFIRTASAPSR